MGIGKTTTIALVCGGILLAAGCSTTKISPEPVFYPPSPAQPKLQYLTSFSVHEDLIPKVNSFKTFILGKDDTAKPAIIKPYGLTIQGTKLYVCDTITAQIHILDFEARTWGYFSPGNMGKFSKPINIAVDSENLRYVTDPSSGKVLIYNSDGHFIGSIEGQERMKPVGIAVSADRVFVGDLQNHKVQVFDKANRQPLFSIPRNPDNEQEKLFSPTNITLDQKGNIYVSDTGAFRIQQYDPEGNYVRTIGSHGDTPGSFARNKGIDVDHNGNLYVVDAASQTLQIFAQDGSLQLFFGEPGSSIYPLILPACVAIDYDNVARFQPYADPNFILEYLVFVTNQYGPRKVAVYGFGNMIQP